MPSRWLIPRTRFERTRGSAASLIFHNKQDIQYWVSCFIFHILNLFNIRRRKNGAVVSPPHDTVKFYYYTQVQLFLFLIKHIIGTQKGGSMNLSNLPKWAWIIIIVAIVLILMVLLKVNINVGSRGASITQDLVH